MVGFDPGQRELSKTEHAAAGATSGVVTRMIAQPLDVLKIRFQLQVEPIRSGAGSKYSSLMQACKCIYQEEGIRAFWKGHVPAQALSVVFGVSQFVTFEFLTKEVWKYLPGYLSTEFRAATHFACGGIAGCVASVTAQPFDVLRTRFVAQGTDRVYKSLLSASVNMVKSEGPAALFKGLVPTLLQTTPHTGLQFGFYAMFTTLWKSAVSHRQASETGGLESLVCGSAAGLAAKLTVYPLDMTKKRLQIQGFQYGRTGFGQTHSYTGFTHCLKTVLREEGMLALYKGLSPSLLKAVVTTASHFYVYEQCCRLLRLRHNS